MTRPLSHGLLLPSLALILLSGSLSQAAERGNAPDGQSRLIPYKSAGGRTMNLYLTQPATLPECPEPRPALVLIHGGGWSSGSPVLLEPMARHFSGLGLIALTIEYRLVGHEPPVRMADALADVRDALAFIRSHAATLGVDPKRIALVGESAGGHLAAAALMGPADDDVGPPASAGALILLNAPLDLESLPWMRRHLALAPLPGQDDSDSDWRERARRFSPLLGEPPRDLPLLLIHGEADTVVPMEQAERVHQEWVRRGLRSTFHRMAGWPHAFALEGYGSPAMIAETYRLMEAFLNDLGWLTPAAGTNTHSDVKACLGDAGHFLSYEPRCHLLNVDGRPFTIAIHALQWAWTNWNRGHITVRLTAPDGHPLTDGPQPLKDGTVRLTVTNGQRGVYRLEVKGNHWIETSLDRAVLWTGETEGHMIENRRAVFLPVVPRRWWFWVPPDVLHFTVKAQRADRYMSQREDWGIFVLSPRGQRVAALWGQPPPDRTPYRQEQEVQVYVEPGAGGRFWALDVQLGDSHNYANINLCLEGVPPYLAASPETWFDPETGALPPVSLYDETPFIQSARLAGMETRWPGLQHFSPCPSLGDPDGIEILGTARFALWNPEDRPLGFRVGSYLSRRPKEAPDQASIRIADSNGNTIFAASRPILHLHGSDGSPSDILRTGAGVFWVTIAGVERWMAFTYPATPLVLLGEPTPEGGRRYRFTVCAPRHWYFFVPPGTRSFLVRFDTPWPEDRIRLEVEAPDRTMAILYDRREEREIPVPEGLSGRIWHLRPSVASAARLTSPPGLPPRYQDIEMTLELRGVAEGLAPTWEQWFDPAHPVPPHERR